ncbi:MAG: NAD(P)H-binding protein, partial [Acetobacteraceae bacterium]|nr:NAD(P)H-binding protein [Acetobacteraceae bacterium]
MTKTNRTALVMGATGGIGGAVAKVLLQRGWQVRALTRNVSAAARRPDLVGLDWREGDAMSAEAVSAAAGPSVDLIVHAVNPPGYRDWYKVVLPMLDNTIAAAKASGARVLLPGAVYNYSTE